jgi:signal transduction histidine kinase
MTRFGGLRTRLLIAFVVTSAVTLLAAAAALLSPLQHRLRAQSQSALKAATLSARGQLQEALKVDPQAIGKAYEVVDGLQRRTNARVALYVLDPQLRSLYGLPDQADDVYEAYTFGHTVESDTSAGTRIAVALSPKDARTFYVLAARKPYTDVHEAVAQVRDAFLKAALIGLAAALVFALILSTTLSRRLGRLRQAALRILRDGMDAPPPRDDTRDEVGDLARAMGAMQIGLRRQETARRRFVATASHELRTPLTSLSGTLELLGEDLEREDFDREDARDQVAFAEGQIQRLRNLATELLDLSRLDAGIELRSEPVELGEVARAVAAEFALQARDSRRTLEVIPPIGPCWAQGDPDAVARVARILIDNALRYAPEGCTVRVIAAYHGASATLAVTDDGPGVPPREREIVFERFQRGSTTAGEGGFGLGLAIGSELAQRLGGTLVYDGEDDQPGARFVLTLPIEMPQGSRRQPDRPPVPSA